MAKNKQEKEGFSTGDKMLIVAAVLAILSVAAIAFVLVKADQDKANQQAELERAAQSSRAKKQQPKISSYDDQSTASVSQEEAERCIGDAIPAAFKAMKKLGLVSGASANVSSLPSDDRKDLLSYFTNAQIFQDFNDNVNVSVQDGETTYGDAVTGLHTVKRPTPDDLYVADKINAQLKSTTTTEYTFTVDLTYHPKGFDKIHQSLTVNVDRSVGKISKVEG